jgi:hypothetical protein
MMTDAEKILVFVNKIQKFDICQIYCAALEENMKPLSEAKEGWTVGTVIEEILETYK